MSRIIMDLDGTLVSHTSDYRNPEPFEDRIAELRRLSEQGAEIVINTGRGSRSTGDYYDMTKAQLDRFGIPWDELYVGHKIVGDVVVDDKAQHSNKFFGGSPCPNQDISTNYE